MTTSTPFQCRRAGTAPTSQSLKSRVHFLLAGQADDVGPELVAQPVEIDAPAGGQDQLDGPAVGQDADHLGDAVAADVLVLGHLLGREGLGVVQLLVGDALPVQLLADPGRGSHRLTSSGYWGFQHGWLT